MKRLARLAAAVLLVASCASEHPGFVRPSVPYAATPDDVAMAMLRLAGVTAADTVYDLGSGDGRLVIAAARQLGARAVGIEIDPRLVQESRERAVTAGVADRVRFVWGDLFATDLRPATVVTLYLLPEINVKLRPKLLAELQPGARIVSHDFGISDWVPNQTIRVQGRDRAHTLHLWRVPARP